MTIHFSGAVQEGFGDDLSFVLDNASYFTSKKVKACAGESGFKLWYRPRYSKQMTPLEKRWREGALDPENHIVDDLSHSNRSIQSPLGARQEPYLQLFLGEYLEIDAYSRELEDAAADL